MADTPLSQVIFNTREEADSADWNRLQHLGGREVRDLIMNQGRPQHGYDMPFTLRDPFHACDVPPTFTGQFGTFKATIGGSTSFAYLTAGLTAEDSAYSVLRWATQDVQFNVPDAVNPRIDLVVATPGTESTDVQSRNIEVDPVTHTSAPANVPKTLNPKATLSVVTGVAGATPVPPAVPAGSVALFEVWVPAAAPNTLIFEAVRRMFRRASWPGNGVNGVLHGVTLKTDFGTDPSAGNPALTVPAGHNVVVIDGEVIDFYWGPSVYTDTLNDPFAVAAPATACVPYYIYACGGRNLPQLSRGTGKAVPVVLVESLTPPNLATGKPTGAIATPRGNTMDGAVYVGLGWLYFGTTNRAPNVQIGDWAISPGFFEATDGGFGDKSLASAPAFSQNEVEIELRAAGPGNANWGVYVKEKQSSAWVTPPILLTAAFDTLADAPNRYVRNRCRTMYRSLGYVVEQVGAAVQGAVYATAWRMLVNRFVG